MDLAVSNLGEFGLNTDVSSVVLSPNTWTEIQNGRCEDQGIGPAVSWVLWNGSVPNTEPTWLLYTSRQDVPYWIICGTSDVYLWDGTSYTQINQAIPNAPLGGRWNGVFDGDIPYVNHFLDAPQYADYPDPNYLTTPTLKDVVYNPNGAPGSQTFRELNYRVRVLRAHKGFLFAGGWNKGGVDQGSLLAWDGGTAANQASNNWVAGPTTLAGEFDCVDSAVGGTIIDMQSLRDDLVIYKEDSAWIARRTGGTSPAWGLKKLIGVPGLIATDCVVSEKGRHYCWGPEDIYVHQGQTAQSIINNKVRKSFISQIDGDNFRNCYAVKHVEKKEIWFCGPTSGFTYPNKALIYQWIDGTFTVTDLPEAPFITPGTRIEEALSWGNATMSWGQASFNWGQRNFSALDKAIIGVKGTELLQFDVGSQRWNGSADESFFTRFERIGVPIGGLKGRNIITELLFSATGTGTLNIYAGSQDKPNGSVDWKGPRQLSVEGNRRVKVRTCKGQYNCWRIDAQTGSDWRVSDMQVVYTDAGER